VRKTFWEDAMKLLRRRFLHLGASAMVAGAFSSIASAQTFPTRPITLVVPFAAGGAFDVIARVITPRLSEVLHQQVVVENVGAAAGIVATNRVAHAPPDGYSVLLGTVGTHAYNPALYKNLPYNPSADFAPVGLVAEQPMVLIARKDIPANTLAEFIAYVKANSAKVQYGSAGVGSTTHLACALLNAATGINVTHVPYRGGGPAMADLIGGQIHYMCSNTPGALPQMQSGTVKGIALLSRERSPLVPALATAHEQGVADFEAISWSGLFLPKGTPAPIVKELNRAVSEAMDSKAVLDRMAELGTTIVTPDRRSPEYLQSLVERDIAKWGPPIKAAGIIVE
jgi:tripartite-type tricarboxylate transporter receptor subunit TctC